MFAATAGVDQEFGRWGEMLRKGWVIYLGELNVGLCDGCGDVEVV